MNNLLCNWPEGRSTRPVHSPVVVWGWQVESFAPAKLDCLSSAERSQLDRVTHPTVRRRSQAARAGLRHMLAGHLGVSPADLQFERGEFGKPKLAGHPHVEFNLTHSGEYILLAIAEQPVGIDLEMPRPLRDLAGMARRIMSPAEFEAWSGTPAGDQLAAFFRIWTAKEAVAKLDGRGLQVTFSQVAFDTSLVRSKPMSTTCQAAWPKGHKLHQCWLHWLIDDPAIVATLATTDPLAIDMVECRRWNGSI